MGNKFDRRASRKARKEQERKAIVKKKQHRADYITRLKRSHEKELKDLRKDLSQEFKALSIPLTGLRVIVDRFEPIFYKVKSRADLPYHTEALKEKCLSFYDRYKEIAEKIRNELVVEFRQMLDTVSKQIDTTAQEDKNKINEGIFDRTLNLQEKFINESIGIVQLNGKIAEQHVKFDVLCDEVDETIRESMALREKTESTETIFIIDEDDQKFFNTYMGEVRQRLDTSKNTEETKDDGSFRDAESQTSGEDETNETDAQSTDEEECTCTCEPETVTQDTNKVG